MAGAEDRLQERLPHYDRGKPGIRALLRPGAQEIDAIDDAIEALRQALYLSTATGDALDAFAARWGLSRNPGELDEQLRKRIRVEILMCLQSATIDELKAALGEYMGWNPNAILISSNWSPTLKDEFPAFFEIRVPMSWLRAEQEQHFKFSDDPENSTYQSNLGFDFGPLKWPIQGKWLDYPLTAGELLDRLAAVGVKFLVGTYGGFRFSLNPTESTFDSETGFDKGGLTGIVG